MKLTVAAVQACPVPGALAANAVTAARLVRQAADRGAQVVVLPELFLSAYHPPAIRADPVGTAVRADDEGRVADERLDPLRESGTIALVGAAVSYPDGRRACSALLIGRDGSVISAYDKQHLWGPDENELFTPGSRGATLELEGWRLGLGICYDGCFPEHGRAAAAADEVHGYLIPSGYVEGSQHRRDVYYAARALDNGMYVVFANNVGGEEPWRFNGGAAIYDPEGRCLARGNDFDEAIVVSTLDTEVVAETRAAHSMLADRLPHQGGPRRQLTV
jgi:predicted amidohydrolase